MLAEVEQEEPREEAEAVEIEETTEEVQSEVVEQEGATPEENTEEVTEDENDEVVVTIGEESLTSDEDEMQDSSVIRNFRKQTREQAKLLKEQAKELEKYKAATEKPAELGKMPELEDFDYDEAKYREGLKDYLAKEQEVKAVAKQAEVEKVEAEKVWNQKLADYGESKAKLKVAGFQEAEETTQLALDDVKQGMIIQYATNPELVVYAIGKNPERAEKFSKIKDSGEFIKQMTLLESTMKVSSKKTIPGPESTVKGSAPKAGTSDNALEKLRKEAEVSGNYNKVMEYNRNKRKK
jgi:hypothetical protein